MQSHTPETLLLNREYEQDLNDSLGSNSQKLQCGPELILSSQQIIKITSNNLF